jgi:Domain of unknown function (DUF4180)
MSGAPRTLAGVTAYLCADGGPRLDGERAATEIIGEAYVAEAKLIVVPVERLGSGFLTLSTRIAGEVIQKFVNYGYRLAFVGDISAAVAASDALRDFVRESNRGRHVWFVDDLAALEAMLSAEA